MISFSAKGGFESAKTFNNSLSLIVRAGSLGGVESSVSLPAMMSHASVPKDIRQGFGLDESIVRLSIGIEDELDLLDDISQALDKIK